MIDEEGTKINHPPFFWGCPSVKFPQDQERIKILALHAVRMQIIRSTDHTTE